MVAESDLLAQLSPTHARELALKCIERLAKHFGEYALAEARAVVAAVRQAPEKAEPACAIAAKVAVELDEQADFAAHGAPGWTPPPHGPWGLSALSKISLAASLLLTDPAGAVNAAASAAYAIDYFEPGVLKAERRYRRRWMRTRLR